MSNTKTIGRTALSVLIVVMVVSAIFAPYGGFVTSATAQEDSDGSLDVCDPSKLSSWAIFVGTGGGSGVYCVVSGLLDSPDEASNSVELEEAAYVQHGSLAETVSQMRGDVNAHSDEWQIIAFSDGEQEIFEARYNDESKSVARGSARLAGNDAYASEYTVLYEGHNEVWEETYTWGRATTTDADANTIISVRLAAIGQASGSTLSSATVEFGENSTLEYGNVSLPNGEEVEVVTRINDVTVSGYDSEPSNYEYADLRILDPDGGEKTVAVEFYNASDEVVETYDANDQIEIVGNDPNGGTDTISIVDGQADNYWLAQAITELESDRTAMLSDVDTRVDEIYTEVAAGEIPPSEYYGPREFYMDYGSAMDSSVAAQLYFHQTVGYDAAPDMRMFVNDSGTEYEGGVLVDDSETAPLVYDETPNPLSSNGDVSLDSHSHKGVLTFDEANETSIMFVDNSDYDTSNISIDLINVDNETVNRDGSNITATFAEKDMQDEEFVIFKAVHDDGTTVIDSGTYVLFRDETTTEIRGFVVGETYSGYSMLYLTGSGEIEDRQLSNSWTLERNLDADFNDKAVAVTHEGVDTSFTGTSAKDRIEQQQTIRDAIGEREDITTTPAGGGNGDGISSWMAGLGGFALGVVAVMGVFFVLLVLYLVGRITSVA
ncbi:hypothetical protein [Halobellus litoreus]|uniref:Envelope protein N-terminal domain-containing protein n=1 Tax=Halobellus litoreus TaxID=755310 RepID=A0ABD6DZP3_9EURY|nr:hypothetical protein [Halobellus litoreus]